MKTITRILMLLVVSVCLFYSGKAFAIVVPEEVPYTYNGITYTSVVAGLCMVNGYTQHRYCFEEALATIEDYSIVHYWCGINSQTYHFLSRSFNPDGEMTNEQEQTGFGPLSTSGGTCSEISDEVLLTSINVVDQNDHSIIRFPRNFSQYVPPGQITYPIKVPEFVPYDYAGVRYTSVIAVLNTQNWYTNHLYCAEETLLEADPGENYFSWRCGLSGQYNHYIVRTYDPDGNNVYDVASESWGPVTSGGDTYSGFTNDTVLTSVNIVDTNNHSVIVFPRNFGTPPVGKLGISPVQYDFGTLNTDICGMPQEFKLANTGGTSLAVSKITLSNSEDFILMLDGGPDPCNVSNPVLVPGDSCTVAIVFCPTMGGSISGSLEVTSNDPVNPKLTVALSGEGKDNSEGLIFPLEGQTAYTAPIASIMDHSMTRPYTKDKIIRAFNGEEGRVEFGGWCYDWGRSCTAKDCNRCSVVGYRKSDGENFFEELDDKKILNYPQSGSSGPNDVFAFYDGHPGYDYPAKRSTDIYVPASGTLCPATNQKRTKGKTLWRDRENCPLPNVVSTSWANFHTFYIIHKGLRINGVIDDYMTVFLHSNNLEDSVRVEIEKNGYAQITIPRHIADVGSYGAGNRNHIHLEVYKYNTSISKWDRVDPYGDGINDILWKDKSPGN